MEADWNSWVTERAAALQSFLLDPLRTTPWTDWHNFWLNQIFDDRFVVVYCLPLVPILLLLRDPHRMRWGIILTGLAFMTYVMGGFYAAFWLLVCFIFYHASQRFAAAIEKQAASPPRSRTPLLFATALIVAWWIGSELLRKLELPTDLAAWLWQHARWLYPLGRRDLPYEAAFALPQTDQLFGAVFWNTHNIGAAYLTMRMLHYFSELKRGTILADRRTALNFFAWLCYAPNMIQGPIERYTPFQSEIDTCGQRRTVANVPPALARIAWGVTKSVIATLYFWPFMRAYVMGENIYYQHPERIPSYALLYFGVYIHIFWLYLEFSGYCDVSAGVARLLGYRQVENFDWPWFATSLRNFWRRWHTSLSAILRDYLYIPLGGNRRHVTLNLMITFGLVGIWHSLRPQLLAWGVLMGGMLAINQIWAQWNEKIAADPAHPLHPLQRAWLRLRPLPQILAWALTMHFFVHSLLLFFGGNALNRVYWELIRRPLGW